MDFFIFIKYTYSYSAGSSEYLSLDLAYNK